jgi:DNA-binding transcriptional LysR family regulator
MTLAAEELHFTQSGVSQHMKTLEETLGIRLFDRVKQRLVPTQAATTLVEKCRENLRSLEAALLDIKGSALKLSGVVSIGVPVEFGNNVVLPLLANFGHDNPLVRFQVRYGFATDVSEAILAGSLDFGFIDNFQVDRRLTTKVVFQEELLLVASPTYVKSIKSKATGKKYFEALEYVDYQQGEPVLRMWFGHHFSDKGVALNTRAYAMDVQGVSRLIREGLGAGVLPSYLVEKLQGQGVKLHVFEGKAKPLKNPISVVHLKERTQSPAAEALFEILTKSLVSQ